MKILSVRNAADRKELEFLLNRDERFFDEIDSVVNQILQDVIQKGDQAVFDWTARLDGVTLDAFKVSETEMEEAVSQTDKGFMEILKEAKENIWNFHQKQKQNS